MTNKKRFTAIGILTAVLITIITCLSLNLYGNKVKGTYAATTDPRYYYFNKTLSFSDTGDWYMKGNIECNGVRYDQIRFSSNFVVYESFDNEGMPDVTTEVYNNGKWVNEIYRYVYVPDITGEDVPNRILNNAIESTSPVIYKGTYTWNDTIVTYGVADISIDFISYHNTSYNIMKFTTNNLQYRSTVTDITDTIYTFSSNTWNNINGKNIEIDTDISPSSAFYTYLLSNFSSFVPTAEPTTYTIEAGEYRGIDSPTFPNSDLNQAINFTSNNTAFTGIRIDTTKEEIYYTNTQEKIAYMWGTWSISNYQYITIQTTQTVNEDFYQWFETNYLPYTTTTYSITYNLTNATKGTNAPTQIKSNESKAIQITPDDGYIFLENPTATNATALWSSTGKGGFLNIENPTGNVTITATATKETPEEYSATITATATGSNANKIETISPSTLTLTSGETQKIVVGITDNAYTITQLNHETGITATFAGNVITVTADTLTENKTINLQISAGLNEASNEQYWAGYDDGEKAGYQSGVKDGEETGYNNGYTAGLEDGKANATVGQQLTYITQIKDSKIDITDITPYLDSTKTTLNLGTISGINSDDSYTAIRFTVNSDLIESDNINFTINWYNGGIVSGTNGFNTTFRAYATYTNTGVKSFDFKSVNNIYTITLPKTYNGESDTIKDFYFTLEKPMPTDIVIVSKSTEFTNGYNSGYTNGMEQGKETGYQQGKEEGLTEGKTQGYQDGYNKGIEEGASLNGLILSIAQVPIDFITNCFNVTILGINIAGLITGFITAAVVIWILKKLL
nr:MAG TPA: flagellar assembly protein H [Inoviridae sp.]